MKFELRRDDDGNVTGWHAIISEEYMGELGIPSESFDKDREIGTVEDVCEEDGTVYATIRLNNTQKEEE